MNEHLQVADGVYLMSTYRLKLGCKLSCMGCIIHKYMKIFTLDRWWEDTLVVLTMRVNGAQNQKRP